MLVEIRIYSQRPQKIATPYTFGIRKPIIFFGLHNPDTLFKNKVPNREKVTQNEK